MQPILIPTPIMSTVEDAPAAENTSEATSEAHPDISYVDLEHLNDIGFQVLINYMVSRIRAAMKAKEDRRVRAGEAEFLRYIKAWDIAFQNEMVGTVPCKHGR